MKDVRCDICVETFPYKTLLDIHIGRKHLVLRNVPCDQCSKHFFNKHDVKDHVAQVHQKERPFKCEKCPATFKRSSGYHIHKNTHKTTRDYACPICNKNFKDKPSANRCITLHNFEGQSFPCHVNNCDVILKNNNTVA